VAGGGEGPVVVSRWWGEWMSEVGWAYLDFREERGREGGFGVFVRLLENGGEGGGGKCDLKAGHTGLKSSTFKRP
jgi:hypothetical protein